MFASPQLDYKQTKEKLGEWKKDAAYNYDNLIITSL